MTLADYERAVTDACRCIYESSQDRDDDHYCRAVSAYFALLALSPLELDTEDCD